MEPGFPLIDRIIGLEWQMFQSVENIGGRASCQDDRATFEAMRRSQFQGWAEAPLESYLADLLEAQSAGRNLVSEKYARMMKSTSPGEYARIEHLLPSISEEILDLIEKIVAVILEWEEGLAMKYPHILKRSRPLRSSLDTPWATSLETYLRGELAACSGKTLELYHEQLLEQKAGGVNGAEVTLAFLVRAYGYASLDEAERRMKEKAEGAGRPSGTGPAA